MTQTTPAPGRPEGPVPTKVMTFWFDERVRPLWFASTPAFDQDRSVSLYEAAGLIEGLRWARHHRDIVRRFGRFPHRNAILGRESTSAEVAWLASEEGYRG